MDSNVCKNIKPLVPKHELSINKDTLKDIHKYNDIEDESQWYYAWPSVRAQVESEVMLLRKGRWSKLADKVQIMLDATPPVAVNT